MTEPLGNRKFTQTGECEVTNGGLSIRLIGQRETRATLEYRDQNFCFKFHATRYKDWEYLPNISGETDTWTVAITGVSNIFNQIHPPIATKEQSSLLEDIKQNIEDAMFQHWDVFLCFTPPKKVVFSIL